MSGISDSIDLELSKVGNFYGRLREIAPNHELLKFAEVIEGKIIFNMNFVRKYLFSGDCALAEGYRKYASHLEEAASTFVQC